MNTGSQYDPDAYFYFADDAREVRFRRHDMPTPWINYLSNGALHAMISQAGGGLAWYRSPQIWRITRYRFYHLPTDRPGPYVYIRDGDTGATWCPTYEPAQTRPQRWEAAHGLGYTRFEAERDGVRARLTYFIGPLENALIWHLELRNRAKQTRHLDVFAYVEFSLMEFLSEVQWQCYIKHTVSVTHLEEAQALIYHYRPDIHPPPQEATPLVYFAANRLPVAFDGDRDQFIGTYRSEANPYAIEHDGCTNSILRGGDPCGALQFKVTLQPDQAETLNVFLGTGKDTAAILASLARLRGDGFVEESFARLQQEWREYLSRFSCTLPDTDVERQVNVWNPYQVQRNLLYSRNISYYATGSVRGVGFRDTAQDVLAQVPFDVESSTEQLRLLLREQYQDGHANHYFYPVENWPPVTDIYSDDHLWPIWAVWDVTMESGDLSFLRETLPYYDGGAATVYEHLRRAIAFTCAHRGANGFPLMLHADWNDMLTRVAREGKGESIWVAMQLGVLLPKLAELARLLGKDGDAAEYQQSYTEQKALVNRLGWDGRWFRRAIMDDGQFLGTHEHDQAQIWLNTQSWSVLSGMAEGERGQTAMDAVYELLDTDLGIKKIHPPITTFPDPQAPLTRYNPGANENGGIFCHADAWAIIAECALGRGERAFKYYRQLIPNVALRKAGLWRYKAEPYAYSSNLLGPDSDKFGWANVSWLTGTAAWMYIAATQYILGVRPQWAGLLVDPCLPSAWQEVGVERVFRGCRYRIRICNASGGGRGVQSLTVDGKPLDSPVIPHIDDRREAVVEVRL
jgi:cellobiose phosphorylase